METEESPNQEFHPDKSTAPKVDPGQLAKLEKDLLEKMERQAEHRKIVEQAEAEMTAVEEHVGRGRGGAEQMLLLLAAVIMIFSLAFLHVILAAALTLFATFILLLAGLTTPKHPASPLLNFLVSIGGLLLFELLAIYTRSTSGINGTFLVYQTLAFIFLLAAFFSTRTYRKKVLEDG